MKRSTFRTLTIGNIINSLSPILLILELKAPGMIPVNQRLWNYYFGYLMVSIIPASVFWVLFLRCKKYKKVEIPVKKIEFNLAISFVHMIIYGICCLPLFIYMASW